MFIEFKDEGEVQGQPVGPVILYEADPYSGDGLPPGSRPLRSEKWLTLTEARQVAELLGVELSSA